jgi:hypothetical protein
MRQELTTIHSASEDGSPTGGQTTAVGLRIDWQNGPFGKGADQQANGCLVETVIIAAIERLQFYQASRFACRENELALAKLQEAIHWLHHRAEERASRHVEGTHFT